MLTNVIYTQVTALVYMFMKVFSVLSDAVNPSSVFACTYTKMHLFKLSMIFSVWQKIAFRMCLLNTSPLHPFVLTVSDFTGRGGMFPFLGLADAY